MSLPPVATIVNFCTNESRYLGACLKEALRFSRQVIVSVCDHFFDGVPEDRKLLEEIYSAFPECLFIEYPFIPNQIPKSIFKRVETAHFWHSFSRLVAVDFLEEEIETVLFLDADEIPEGEKMRRWFEESDYHQHTVLKLANYWYFRLPEYQAEQWEDSPVLAQRSSLSPEALLHTEERQAIYDLLPGPKKRNVLGIEGAPMVHHYSWVRTEEEMLKKVESWGHREDLNWSELVKEEFSRPFSGKDFVHGYCYRTVSCPFEELSSKGGEILRSGKGRQVPCRKRVDSSLELPVQISLHPVTFSTRGKPQVKRLTDREVLRVLRSFRPLRRFFALFRGRETT